jgi:hypothetical protein
VRRLACTIHSREDGRYRGSFIIDDSKGLGQSTFKPAPTP